MRTSRYWTGGDLLSIEEPSEAKVVPNRYASVADPDSLHRYQNVHSVLLLPVKSCAATLIFPITIQGTLSIAIMVLEDKCAIAGLSDTARFLEVSDTRIGFEFGSVCKLGDEQKGHIILSCAICESVYSFLNRSCTVVGLAGNVDPLQIIDEYHFDALSHVPANCCENLVDGHSGLINEIDRASVEFLCLYGAS